MSGFSFGAPVTDLIKSLAVDKIGGESEEEKKKKQALQAQAQAFANGATNMKKGGKVSSASKRADGVATKGKTRGKMM